MPKAEKFFKAPEDFSAISFNKILDAAPHAQKVAATAPQIPAGPDGVFEQVEPKLLQIIALNNLENEKKVMKMRSPSGGTRNPGNQTREKRFRQT